MRLPVIAIVVSLTAGHVRADNWHQFRKDPQRTAATNEELSGSLTIRWKRGFQEWPHVFAELAVVDGRVYCANMDGVIYCLDAHTTNPNGQVLWQYSTGAPIPTTPAVVGNRVHVVNLRGRIVTLDTTGRVLWEYQLPGGVYANHLVTGGRLYVGTVRGKFYCFDAARGGSPLWTYHVGAMIDAAPCELNGKVIFAAENMQAYCLDGASGAVVWTSPLPGARTWNAHPVASAAANKIFLSLQCEFEEPTSTNREIFSMYEFENRKDQPLSSMLQFAEGFVSRNRKGLTPAVVLHAATGQPVSSFTVAPTNITIAGLSMNSWYWQSIRPCLWQGDKLYLQSMWRNILIELSTNHIRQPNADQRGTGHFVRGDEQVPVSIGGNRVYGGIGNHIEYLDLTNGTVGTLFGPGPGSEEADLTPITQPLSSRHYCPFPGDGFSDRIGTFIVSNGHGFYVQYGWVYCFDGRITVR